MTFAIGQTDYYNTLGFDTTHWRKSLDGTLAVVHYDTVEHVADVDKLTLYRHDDKAFKDVMQSNEWTEEEPAAE